MTSWDGGKNHLQHNPGDLWWMSKNRLERFTLFSLCQCSGFNTSEMIHVWFQEKQQVSLRFCSLLVFHLLSFSLSINTSHWLISFLSHGKKYKIKNQMKMLVLPYTNFTLFFNKQILNHHPDKHINHDVCAVRLTYSVGVMLFKTTKAGVCTWCIVLMPASARPWQRDRRSRAVSAKGEH